MLLCVDVGNTNIVFGLFEKNVLQAKFRLTTDAVRTADEIGLMVCNFFRHFELSLDAVADVIVGSVVPPVMYTLRHALEKYIGKPTVIVGESIDTGLVNLCQEPLGVDRAVTGLGAMALYGQPAMVIDFGTATKVDAFNAAGEYMGGVITPGIKISMDALFARAAKLPRVEIKKPRCAIGVNTEEQMVAGVVYGYVGSIMGITGHMRAEMNITGHIPVIATGGLAKLIAEHTPVIDIVDQNLTLQGLRVVFERGLV